MDSNELAHFRRHTLAAFDGDASGGEPPWLLRDQISLKAQIEQAGMESKLLKFHEALSSRADDANEPFEVFVIGEGNHGKSTLINALFGRPLAAVDRQPKTWCFNRYIACNNPSDYVKIITSTSIANYPHLASRLRRTHKDFRGHPCFLLTQAEAETAFREEEERTHEALRRSETYSSPILEMEWEVPAENALLPGLRLVDTMGTDHFLLFGNAHRHHLSWQYARADAVIWITAADKLGDKGNRDQFEQCRRYHKPIVMLLNKIDRISNAEAAVLRAERDYGHSVRKIIPFSALHAFLSRQPRGYEYTAQDQRLLSGTGLSEYRDLYGKSGLELLIGQFEEILHRKGAVTRNRGAYVTLREKQRQIRNGFIAERQATAHNLQCYRRLRKMLDAAKQACMDRIHLDMRERREESRRTIDAGIGRIDYMNKGAARSILQLDQMNVLLNQTSRDLSDYCSGALRPIIAQSQRPENLLMDNEYAPIGAPITMSLQSISIRTTDDKSASAQWDMRFSRGFLDSLLSLDFGQAWDNVKAWWWKQTGNQRELDRHNEKLRIDMKSLCIAKLDIGVQSATESLARSLNEQYSAIISNLDSNLKQFGGEQALESKLLQIDGALPKIAVPAVFLSASVRFMRKHSWPKCE
ncbi:MAG: 50S ribosome-binding GTPase [Capsulimonadaceae bacterium]|nr:50S ribosome-binding GTPase [Capsulimonadaceae bacterium]